jgi:hypothetical protein
MKQETLEEREPYWDLVDKKAEQNNTIDLDAYAKGVQDGVKWQQEQDKWKEAFEETPPIHIELLVKSPTGVIHLASWRESYNIFTCQAKTESSLDWKWKTI